MEVDLGQRLRFATAGDCFLVLNDCLSVYLCVCLVGVVGSRVKLGHFFVLDFGC
jgi:hypothetical protein